MCPSTEFFWSVFSRIRNESGEILRISPDSVQMRKYFVSLWIQPKYGKIRTRKNSLFGHFSHSEGHIYSNKCAVESCRFVQVCMIFQWRKALCPFAERLPCHRDNFFKSVFSIETFRNYRPASIYLFKVNDESIKKSKITKAKSSKRHFTPLFTQLQNGIWNELIILLDLAISRVCWPHELLENLLGLIKFS